MCRFLKTKYLFFQSQSSLNSQYYKYVFYDWLFDWWKEHVYTSYRHCTKLGVLKYRKGIVFCCWYCFLLLLLMGSCEARFSGVSSTEIRFQRVQQHLVLLMTPACFDRTLGSWAFCRLISAWLCLSLSKVSTEFLRISIGYKILLCQPNPGSQKWNGILKSSLRIVSRLTWLCFPLPCIAES